MAQIAERRGVPFVAINPEQSPFTRQAMRLTSGLFVRATAGATLPSLCEALAAP